MDENFQEETETTNPIQLIEEKKLICELVAQALTQQIETEKEKETDISELIKPNTVEAQIVNLLEHFHEEPLLLDSILPNVITSVLNWVKKNGHQEGMISIVYTAARIRGMKYTVKYFPHEATDLQLVLKLKSAQHSWKAEIVYLLWLSSAVLVPFALQSILTDKSLLPILYSEAVSLLSRGDLGRHGEVAALFVANLIARPDMREYFEQFFTLSSNVLSEFAKTNSNKDQTIVTGVMSTLSILLEKCDRETILPFSKMLFDTVQWEAIHSNIPSTTLRKALMKLIQRLCLCLLKPIPNRCRYQRERRILHSETSSSKEIGDTIPEMVNTDEEEIDVPEQVDIVIDKLLNGLTDKDTVVRWSCAKGIGSICQRLPWSYADQIIDAITENITNNISTEVTLHGSCFALAEIIRRGIVHPKKIAELIPPIKNVLIYDEARGAASVGAYIRDSGCYLCWSLTRRYSSGSTDLVIAQTLLSIAVFDREVNCRRAAAAAFQEHVGRNGTFPHGIEIIGEANYFSLGNRKEAYLSIAPKFFCFAPYRLSLLDHLLKQTTHWDKEIRLLAAKSFGEMAKKCVSDEQKSDIVAAFSKLHTLLLPPILPVHRHGYLLALAFGLKGAHEWIDFVDKRLIDDIVGIVVTMENERMFRGNKGEIVRDATCKLIQSIAINRLSLKEATSSSSTKQVSTSISTRTGITRQPKSRIAILQTVLDDCLIQPHEFLQLSAAKALSVFTKSYYVKDGKAVAEKTIDNLLTKYLSAFAGTFQSSQRGYALALGGFCCEILERKKEEVINTLVKATTISKIVSERDVETRRNAVISLSKIVSTLKLTGDLLLQVLLCILRCFFDYSTDTRGDVGSWVREVALDSLSGIVYETNFPNEKFVDDSLRLSIIRSILTQMGQKINRTREVAAKTFTHVVLDPKSPLFEFANSTKICSFFQKQEVLFSSSSFDVLASALIIPDFCEAILEGIVSSSGGLAKEQSEMGTASLVKFLEETPSHGQLLFETFLHLLQHNKNNNRIVTPLLTTIAHLISDMKFDYAIQSEKGAGYLDELTKLCFIEVKTNEVRKIQQILATLCSLIPYEVKQRDALRLTISLLTHPFPKIREQVSGQLYSVLMITENIPNIDKINQILLETVWTSEALVPKELKDNNDWVPLFQNKAEEIATLLGTTLQILPTLQTAKKKTGFQPTIVIGK